MSPHLFKCLADHCLHDQSLQPLLQWLSAYATPRVRRQTVGFSPEEHEDFVQEVLLKLICKAPTIYASLCKKNAFLNVPYSQLNDSQRRGADRLLIAYLRRTVARCVVDQVRPVLRHQGHQPLHLATDPTAETFIEPQLATLITQEAVGLLREICARNGRSQVFESLYGLHHGTLSYESLFKAEHRLPGPPSDAVKSRVYRRISRHRLRLKNTIHEELSNGKITVDQAQVALSTLQHLRPSSR